MTLLAAQEIAKRIRDKVADLNEELALAASLEVDVEFEVRTPESTGITQLRVFCSQEV